MTKETLEDYLGKKLAEIHHALELDKDRAKKWQDQPALRARLQGQWAILHELVVGLKLNMKNIRAVMQSSLHGLGVKKTRAKKLNT